MITTLKTPAVSLKPLWGPARCRRHFLSFFPQGFKDPKYLAWERDYKLEAHREWLLVLDRPIFRDLLRHGKYHEAADRAVRIESRRSLLFSFEKMALRDAVKSDAGAKIFAEGLYQFLHGTGSPEHAFERWCEAVSDLPRRQTRVLAWPVLTVFPFIARPETHLFLKPNTIRLAAARFGFDFHYRSRPSWETYESLLAFAAALRHDLRDLRPRDMIDIQSYMWVLGSDEYER